MEHQSASDNVQNVSSCREPLVPVIRLTFRVASLQPLHRASHVQHPQFLVLLRLFVHTEHLLDIPLELIIRLMADQYQFGQILG